MYRYAKEQFLLLAIYIGLTLINKKLTSTFRLKTYIYKFSARASIYKKSFTIKCKGLLIFINL